MAYDKNGWNVTNPNLPIRCLSGRDDPCMLSERKFMKSVSLLDKAGYESVSFRLFDGMRHELLHEKNSVNVYKDIAKTLYSWLDRIGGFNAEAEMTAVPEEEAVELLGVPETFTPAEAEKTQDKAPKPVHTSEADVFEILESVRTAEEAKDAEQKG